MNYGALESILKNGGALFVRGQMHWFLIFRSGKNYGGCFACLPAKPVALLPGKN
jgi:hypothetical protein